MKESNANEVAGVPDNNEASIFDSLKPKPEYYSERAVYVFSLLLGAYFGAILMALNLKKTEEQKGVWQVLLFGFGYTITELVIGGYLHKNSAAVSIALNIGGAYILRNYFWKKYIGNGTPYTKKSVLVPLIVAALLVAVVVSAMIYSPATN